MYNNVILFVLYFKERILKRQREFSNIEARILIELDQLEEREKLVRSKFDTSVKLSGDINDNGSQVVANVHTKGKIMFYSIIKKKKQKLFVLNKFVV